MQRPDLSGIMPSLSGPFKRRGALQVAVGRLSVVHDPGNMMEHRDMDEKLKANLSGQSIWQRLLFMILFAAIFNIA
ncbi:MAG: hypothetical protein VCF08_13775 [Alphaproteobacteria bacterium]